jgi:CDP-diacylglycerol---glycerol-3-phosphate 3-phosphatidyltransferase
MRTIDGERTPAARRATIWSLPNLLGLGRILATPIIMFLLVAVPFPGAALAAFLVGFAAGVTDIADGQIARARGQVSPLGVFMDLTADKVLVAGVLIAMVEIRLLPAWIAAVIVIREIVVQGARLVAAADGVVVAARDLGKAKTLVTLAAMGLLILSWDASTGGPMQRLGAADALLYGGIGLMLVAVALTVVSGILYLRALVPHLVR